MYHFVSVIIAFVLIGITGISYADLFSIALKLKPQKAIEISSLLIVGVSGGAMVAPLLDIPSDIFKYKSCCHSSFINHMDLHGMDDKTAENK